VLADSEHDAYSSKSEDNDKPMNLMKSYSSKERARANQV
jgi:hypothetical protein